MAAGTGYTLHEDAFDADYLAEVKKQVRKSPYFTTNNLNRDFVGTRGFSVVFRRTALPRVLAEFPWARRYLERALCSHRTPAQRHANPRRSGSHERR